MKRYVILTAIVSAVMIVAFNAFGQDNETPAQKMQKQKTEEQAPAQRERFRNTSPEDREKFRAEMEEMSKKIRNMSDEERAKLREQMRQRYSSRTRSMERGSQFESIKAIEAQVAKLKAAVEAGISEERGKLRELSQEERTKIREKMVAAMRERQTAIRAIERELVKLKGPNRPVTMSEARLSELRAIHKLALKEKATQTADRLDKLIMGIQRGSVDREQPAREGRERQRIERPARQEKTE